MFFSRQISITSLTAAGKTTLVRELRKLLGEEPYRWISAGGLMRERAEAHGMTMEEFARHMKLHPEEGHDQWLDGRIAELAGEDGMVSDGRLVHYFMPGAFKVWVECGFETRATRRHRQNPDKPFWQVVREVGDRDHDDEERYRKLYPGCIWKPQQFDLVLDSEHAAPHLLAARLVREHGRWLEKHASAAAST
jgi:cytidylate kinase